MCNYGVRDRKEIGKNIVEIRVSDSSKWQPWERGGHSQICFQSLPRKHSFYPSLCSSSSSYLQWLTQVNPHQADIWSGWLNIRVEEALSRQRPTQIYLSNTAFLPNTLYTLPIRFALQCWKVKFGYGETFGHWMGYENAGGAVWLGTKQDLVVQHTLWTLRHTMNFETHC